MAAGPLDHGIAPGIGPIGGSGDTGRRRRDRPARSASPLRATTIIDGPIERIGQYRRAVRRWNIGSNSVLGFIGVTSLASLVTRILLRKNEPTMTDNVPGAVS